MYGFCKSSASRELEGGFLVWNESCLAKETGLHYNIVIAITHFLAVMAQLGLMLVVAVVAEVVTRLAATRAGVSGGGQWCYGIGLLNTTEMLLLFGDSVW